MTPTLATHLLTTTPHQREDVSALDRSNVHRCPTWRVLQPTASSAAIQAQVAPSLGPLCLLESYEDTLLKDSLGSRRPLHALPVTPPIDASVSSGATHEKTGLQWNGTRSSLAKRESILNLSSDDYHVRVWKPRGERLNPAFVLQQQTTPTAGVMVWGAIAHNTRSPLAVIRGAMRAQWYVHDIPQPHVLPLM
ncbi:transposable element Tcb2 transposase [Trichonephila clavipes]|nr:transposable element Tcb2 transposase [Trichonephila clavipes]